MPSSHRKIPCPASFKGPEQSKICITMAQIAEAADWKLEDLLEFRTSVIISAEAQLDRTKFEEGQDPTKWNSFVAEMIEKFPKLSKYKDHWPLKVYYAKYISDRLSTLRRKQDKSSKSDEDVFIGKKRKADFKDDHTFAKKRTTRAMNEVATSKSVAERYPTAPNLKGPIYYIGKRPPRLRRIGGNPAPSVQDPATESEDGTESPQTSPHSRARHSSEPLNERVVWPQFCFVCGLAAMVPDSCTTELRQAFPGRNAGLIHMLRTIGILHDRHFRILVALDKSQRDNFLSSFSRTKWTQVQVFQIIQTIESYIADHPADVDGFPGDDGMMSTCPRHTADYQVEVPEELGEALSQQGMEELGPPAVRLGVNSNQIFHTIRCLDAASKRGLFDNPKDVELKPFQRFMLKIVFS